MLFLRHSNLGILLCILSLKFSASTFIYPSIEWTPFNPNLQTDFPLAVLPMTKIKIVCPNPATNPALRRHSIPYSQLFENVWMVNKQAYDTCTVDPSNHTNKIVMKCDTPTMLHYRNIVFNRYTAEADGLEFEAGKQYYFIATSNGTVSSLNQHSGGRCATHNMKIMIYVCKDVHDPWCKKTFNALHPPQGN